VKSLPFFLAAVLLGSLAFGFLGSGAIPASRPVPPSAFPTHVYEKASVPQADWTVLDIWWDFGSNDIFFDSSPPGGSNWHADVRVNDLPGSAFGGGWQLPLPAVAVDPVTWAIYVAWMDSRNGNFDIYASASTDGGSTWSANTRVNDDTGTAMQWMVDLAVDSHGTVHAAWEDKRNGSLNIFYANSTDGGASWSSNVRISSANTPGTYNRPGDYFALEAGPNDQPYLVWTDGRGADFDIFFARGPAFTNVKITDGSSPFAWQVEPTMVINRSGTVFAGWKETNGPETAGLRVGASFSTDQGATWAPNILMDQSHPGGGCSNSDPWMALAPDDRVQYAYLEYSCSNGSNGLNLANTTDWAWGTVHYAPGAGGLTDKDSIIVAPTGRIFAAWDEGNVMDVTWTDDGGSTWAPFEDPDDSPGGVLGAVIQIGGPVATVTIGTSPTGLPVTVDGKTSTSPVVYGWAVGSVHNISVASPIPAGTGTRLVWTSWSDGGAIAHTIVADADHTFIASFQRQYTARVTPSPTGLQVLVDGVPITATTSFWWDDGSTHSVSAPSPQSVSNDVRYVWSSWSDSGAASHSVSASGVLALTARFIQQQALRITTSPSGLNFTVDGANYTAATTFWFLANSSHVIAVRILQSGTGTRYTFVDWSDGGAAVHIVSFSGAMSLEARFSVEYYLMVTSPVSGASGSGWYPAGATVVAEVATTNQVTGPGERLVFQGWSGDATGTSATSADITMDGPKTATATWQTQYYLQVDSGVGTVAGSGWYAAGATVEVTAPSTLTEAGTTYHFAGWTGSVTSSDPTISFTISGPTRVHATWQSAAGPESLGAISPAFLGLAVIGVAIALVLVRLAWLRRRRRD